MILRVFITFAIILFAVFNNVSAQDDLQSFIEKVSETNIDEYVKPSVIAFGTAINSGLFHTAKAHKTGGFDVTIKGVVVLIPDNAKTFTARLPGGGSDNWSTIFGEAKKSGENLNPGGLDTRIFPMGVPQIGLGIGSNSELLLRFLKFNLSDYGDISLYGFGFKHNLNRFLPNVPLMPNVSVQAAFQRFKTGDIVEANSISFNAHTSLDLIILSFFGGISYDHTSVDLNYIVNNPLSEFNRQSIAYTAKANHMRLVLGARAKLGLLSLNAEFNLGKYNAVSGGIGITFR